jgi:hypothetical protein
MAPTHENYAGYYARRLSLTPSSPTSSGPSPSLPRKTSAPFPITSPFAAQTGQRKTSLRIRTATTSSLRTCPFRASRHAIDASAQAVHHKMDISFSNRSPGSLMPKRGACQKCVLPLYDASLLVAIYIHISISERPIRHFSFALPTFQQDSKTSGSTL